MGHLTQVTADVVFFFGNRVFAGVTTVNWGRIWLAASFKGDMWVRMWRTTGQRCTKVRGVVCQPRMARLSVTGGMAKKDCTDQAELP